MSEFGKRVLRSLQEYYVSRRQAAIERDSLADSNAYCEYGTDENGVSCSVEYDDMEDFDVEDEAEVVNPVTEACRGVHKMFQITTEDVIKSSVAKMCLDGLIPTSGSSEYVRRWPLDRNSGISADSENIECSAESAKIELACMKASVIAVRSQFVEEANFGKENSKSSEDFQPSIHPTSAITTVEHLKIALEADEALTEYPKIPAEPEEHVRFPAIGQMADRYTLNPLQRHAFRLAALALLQKIADGYCQGSIAKEPTAAPFKMYLGGEGGTGKSRIIEALVYLAKMWDRPGAVRTCAPTGIAASLVNGQTFHSLVGLRGGENFDIRKKPSAKSMEELAGLLMLVVDEISMLGRKNLAALSSYLKLIKDKNGSTEHFGGVLMVFSGEFFKYHQLGATLCTWIEQIRPRK